MSDPISAMHRVYTDTYAYTVFRLAQRLMEFNTEHASGKQCQEVALDFTQRVMEVFDAARAQVIAEQRCQYRSGGVL
jgi:hypothetical protein